MKYDITIDEVRDLFVVHTVGPIELEIEKNMVCDVIGHPRWGDKFNIIFDHSESSLDHLQAIDIQKLSNIIKNRSVELGYVKLAIVLSTDLSYGLGRMWEAYTSDFVECDIAIFRSYNEAETWLKPN